ncbi:TetR/AcrR family transcriptional regulator [Hyalangium versicolor]|uniref:TetR/AcrR family transcriptional regulator n=1 Tax=Hyalangium versicolor TaxID=2861190 RepID=UPI001CCA6D2A|nr:TetR/AcrR family transcriptional regulator [Hyalangium versicolor]
MNPRSKSERPLKERLREAVREEILASAERVFGERGLQGAKMEEIALGAGVSVGTLYNHFEDREALLGALMDERRAEIRARLDEVLEQTRAESFRDQLTQFLSVYLDHFGRHRAFFTMLVDDELRSGRGRMRGQTALKEITARHGLLVERGLEQGALRKEDATLYPALLVGFLKGFFTYAVQDEAQAISPTLVEAMVRTFLEGAGARK